MSQQGFREDGRDVGNASTSSPRHAGPEYSKPYVTFSRLRPDRFVYNMLARAPPRLRLPFLYDVTRHTTGCPVPSIGHSFCALTGIGRTSAYIRICRVSLQSGCLMRAAGYTSLPVERNAGSFQIPGVVKNSIIALK